MGFGGGRGHGHKSGRLSSTRHTIEIGLQCDWRPVMDVRIHTIPLGFDRCYVLEGRGVIAIDAGSANKGRAFLRGLERASIRPDDVRLIVLTHAHWDHLMGFPFFKPLFLSSTEIHMHRAPFHKKFMESMFSKVMAPPNFPVRYSDLKAKIVWEEGHPAEFKIGATTVVPIAANPQRIK